MKYIHVSIEGMSGERRNGGGEGWTKKDGVVDLEGDRPPMEANYNQISNADPPLLSLV